MARTYWEEYIDRVSCETYLGDRKELLKSYHYYLLQRGFTCTGPDNPIPKGDPNDRVS